MDPGAVRKPRRHDPIRALPTPRPASVFGGVPKSTPQQGWLRHARQRTNVAQRRAEKNIVLPRIPAHVAPKNRGYAAALVAASAHRQGINTAQEARNLPRAQRQTITRAAHGFNTQEEKVQRRVARMALTPEQQRGLTKRELTRVGRAIVQSRAVRAHEGPAPTRLNAMGVNVNLSSVFNHTLRPLADKFASGQGVALTNFVGHGVVPWSGRLVSDAVNFPKTAVLGAYGLGHAGVKAAEGDTTEAKRLLHGLTHGAAGDLLLHGDVKGALKQFSEHPFYAALDFSGLEGAAGRTLGTAARVGGRLGREGNVLARAGSTVRAPLRLGDTGQVVERRYSQDLIRKSLQVLTDRHHARGGRDPNVAQGNRLNRELLKAADETAAQAEGMRRAGRSQSQVAATRLNRDTPRAVRDLVQSAVEGELRGPATLKEDLRAKHARLQAAWNSERTSMTADAKRNNRSQRKAIEAVLADPKKLEKAKGIFDVADQYKAHADAVERDLIKTGALESDQAKAAKLRTYAVAHMGARYDHRKVAPEELVARHEQARAVEQKARENLAAVKSRLESAKARRARLVGRNSSQRGVDRARGGEPRSMLRREADRAGSMDGATRNVKALRLEYRQAEAAWRKARRDRVASSPKKYVTGLVDAQGKHITTRMIEEHIAADPNARVPAFVSHKPGVGGTGAHFVNWFGGRRGADGPKARTGEAARLGGQDPTMQALTDSLVRGRGVAEAAKAFDRFVGRVGLKHPSGRMFSWDEALKYNEARTHHANGDPISGVENMVPVRVVPAKYRQDRADAIVSGQGSTAHEDLGSVVQQRLLESRKAPTGREKDRQNVVLVPESQFKRLKEHQTSGTSEVGKVAQAVTGAFRSTVLPFSAKWLTGNTVEAALRLAINDTPVGLVASARAGRRVLKSLHALDEQAAREFDVRATGGLLYGGQRTVYGGVERFAGTKYERAAKTIEAVRQVPVVKQAVNGVSAYEHKVFALNGKLEHMSQVVAVGKEARREIHSVTGSWGKAVTAQKAAVEDVARGLVNTPAQVRYARMVDETLGKYNRFGPNTRRVIQTAAPFLPWYLNSIRFIYHTLPVRHPVLTAVLASAEQTLRADFQAEHKDLPPGGLQSSIPTRDGGWLDIQRFTPFGVMANGAKTITDPFLPQISGVVAILNGNSWTGNKLRTHDGSTPGEGKQIGLALYAALESIAPGVQIARRIREGGQTAFDDSTIFKPYAKPNTAGPGTKPGVVAGLNRVFNPLRPTYLNAGPTVSTGAGGGHTILDAINQHRATAADAPGGSTGDLLDRINAYRP